nr:leucine-rich repeat-containing protein 74A [Ciona intestinalis]|eukprot:XP_002127082.1 leucine-rich repeat-containing protein 74A [Ciona intestinalis]
MDCSSSKARIRSDETDVPISDRAMLVLSRAAKRSVQKQQRQLLMESNIKYRRYLKSSGDGVGRRKKPTVHDDRCAMHSAPPAIHHVKLRDSSLFQNTPRIVIINASQGSEPSSNTDRTDSGPKVSRSREITARSAVQTQDFSDTVEEELAKPEFYDNESPTNVNLAKQPFVTPRSTVSSMNWAWVHERLASRESNTTRPETSMTFRDFLDGLDPQSDEYDTDLEDDFVNYHPEVADLTGATHYKKICCQRSVPTSQKIVEKLSDKNFQFLLHHRSLSSKDTLALSAALLHNTFVEQLDLSGNSINDDGAKHVIDMLKKNSNICRLNLGSNQLKNDSGYYISSMLCTNTSLTHICISHNTLADKEALHLCEALKLNSTLQSLDVSHNQFTDSAGQAFAAMLMDNSSLTSLNLSWNMLGKIAAAALGQCFKVNSTLQSLDLSWNGLGDEGAALLGRPLRHNSNLRHLSLAVNHIGPFGAERLASSICGIKGKKIKKTASGLTTLVLDRNPLGRKGVMYLLKHLQQSDVFTELSIKEVVLSPDLIEMLRQMIKSRPICVFYEGQNEQERKKCSLYGGSVHLHRVLARGKIISAQFLKAIATAEKIKIEDLRNAVRNLKKCSNEIETERLISNLDPDRDNFILHKEVVPVVYKTPPVKNVSRRRISRVKF